MRDREDEQGYKLFAAAAAAAYLVADTMVEMRVNIVEVVQLLAVDFQVLVVSLDELCQTKATTKKKKERKRERERERERTVRRDKISRKLQCRRPGSLLPWQRSRSCCLLPGASAANTESSRSRPAQSKLRARLPTRGVITLTVSDARLVRFAFALGRHGIEENFWLTAEDEAGWRT